MAHRWAFLLITSCLARVCLAEACDGHPNRAAAFGWQSSVDTDLAFSEFRSDDFTLMMTFLLQYPNA